MRLSLCIEEAIEAFQAGTQCNVVEVIGISVLLDKFVFANGSCHDLEVCLSDDCVQVLIVSLDSLSNGNNTGNCGLVFYEKPLQFWDRTLGFSQNKKGGMSRC